MFSAAYQIVERNFLNLMGYEKIFKMENSARFRRFKIFFLKKIFQYEIAKNLIIELGNF